MKSKQIKQFKEMKKLFSYVAMLLLPVAVSAQVIVGGSIGIDAQGSKASSLSKVGDKEVKGMTKGDSDFGLEIAPKVGYIINDKLEVGASLGLVYNQTMKYASLLDKEGENPKAFKDNKTSTFSWSINPYARYCVVDANGFGLWIEGLVSLGTSAASKVKYYDIEYDGVTHRDNADELNKKDKDAPKYSCFNGGLYIQPVLTYAVTEHFRLEATLNFLGVNLSGSVVKNTDKDGNWTKNNDYYLGLNINQGNLLSVGCVYSF